MYKKFKDCLFAPRNIADYINEPKRKTLLYTIFLLFLYVLPMLIIIIFTANVSSSISKQFSEDFNGKEIHYVVEENNLKKTDETVGVEYVVSSLEFSGRIIKTVFVFDLTNEQYMSDIELDNGTYLLLVFSQTNLDIKMINYENANSGPVDPGIEQLSNEERNELSLFNASYEQLKLDSIDFTLANAGNEFLFSSEITSLVNSIYKYIKNKLLVVIILIIIFVGIGSYFLSVLFVAFLEKLFYGYLHLSFGKFLKATILCSTPYVICCIISSLTGFTILEVIGDLLMIIYVTKTITAYKIKYDGGMPLPRYMNFNINNNNNNNNEEEHKEKGSDDDEL